MKIGPVYDKILGTFLGVALGDAMGMPAEGFSRERLRRQFGEITDFLPGPEDNPISAGFRAYETTDDTAVTVLVAELLLESPGLPDPLVLVKKIETWAEKNGKSRTVIGPSTRRAFDRIHAGVPIDQAGREGMTNGASMRIAPVGMCCDYRREKEFDAFVARLCLPTHNTAPAIAGAAAVAAAVSHGIYGGSREGMLSAALSAAERGGRMGADLCSASIPARLRLAAELSDRYGQDGDFLQSLYEVVGTGLPSSESVPAALAVAYRTDCDLMASIRLCANAGGDTDTMGAIAGAVCGAHGGASMIPSKHAAAVCMANPFPFERLAAAFASRVQKHG